MARNHANTGRVYRAVVVRTLANGTSHKRSYGPYDTAAPAKGLITREECHGRGAKVHGWIESAEVVWMREAE